MNSFIYVRLRVPDIRCYSCSRWQSSQWEFPQHLVAPAQPSPGLTPLAVGWSWGRGGVVSNSYVQAVGWSWGRGGVVSNSYAD